MVATNAQETELFYFWDKKPLKSYHYELSKFNLSRKQDPPLF